MKLDDDSLPNSLHPLYIGSAGVYEKEGTSYEVLPGLGNLARSSESRGGTDEPTRNGNGKNRQRSLDDQVLCRFGARAEDLRRRRTGDGGSYRTYLARGRQR